MAVLGWHFLLHRGKLARYHDAEAQEAKEAPETETHSGYSVLCLRGLHASTHLIDAIMQAPGTVLRRVRCSGKIAHAHDKLVCTERQILGTADIGQLLLDFTAKFGSARDHMSAKIHYEKGYRGNFVVFVRGSSDFGAHRRVREYQSTDPECLLVHRAKMEQEKWLLEQIRDRYPELAIELPTDSTGDQHAVR